EELVCIARLDANDDVAGHRAGNELPGRSRRVAGGVTELVEDVRAEVEVTVRVVAAHRVAAIAAVGALVDDGGDDLLAVLAGDLHAGAAIQLRVEAVLAGDRREVGAASGAHVGDVLDGVHGILIRAALRPVVAASCPVAAAVHGGSLPEGVPGERSATAVVGGVARRRPPAAV